MASWRLHSQVSWFLGEREGSPFTEIRSFYVINLLSNFYDGPSCQITAGDTGDVRRVFTVPESGFGFSGCTLQYGKTTVQLISVRWRSLCSRVKVNQDAMNTRSTVFDVYWEPTVTVTCQALTFAQVSTSSFTAAIPALVIVSCTLRPRPAGASLRHGNSAT